MRTGRRIALANLLAGLCALSVVVMVQLPLPLLLGATLPAQDPADIPSMPVDTAPVSSPPPAPPASIAKTARSDSPNAQADQSSPLSQRLLVAVVPAILTGLVSWAVSRSQSKRDIQKVQAQIEAQYLVERRTRAAQVLDTLLFQADLLRTQLEAVKGMLTDEQGSAPKMRSWFMEIKEECAKGTAKDAPEFSAKCHYHLIFAMTTLYYTAVYFLYAQEMRHLVPFTRLSLDQQADLDRKLTGVSNAFARTETDRLAEEKGLWMPVQDNMGVSVRKDGSHKSYSEFCRLFVDTTFEREDHVFLRPLDFYGANPAVCLDVTGTAAIIRTLNALVEFRQRD